MKRDIYTHMTLAHRVISTIDISPGMKIIDLGCGDGVFLEAITNCLRQCKKGILLTVNDLSASVFGVELDPNLAGMAIARLERKFGKSANGWQVQCTDALTLDESHGFDIVVGNPPWVRIHHMEETTKEVARSRFEVARGAFDLYHIFIEKAVRLLRPGGQLALIVPQALRVSPASEPVRRLLSREGVWSLSDLSTKGLTPRAAVRPALLIFRKHIVKPSENSNSLNEPVFTLGQIADVTSGVPTGCDPVFLITVQTVKDWHLEFQRMRPVIRGRDITSTRSAKKERKQIVWPYRWSPSGYWELDDLSDSPNVLRYLASHKQKLSMRPRLAKEIKRNPSHWYKFIDPNRYKPNRELRIAVADVFREPTFAIVDDENTIIHNSCYQLVPKHGYTETLITLVERAEFWETLSSQSRTLENGFHRTSVNELRTLPLTSLL